MSERELSVASELMAIAETIGQYANLELQLDVNNLFRWTDITKNALELVADVHLSGRRYTLNRNRTRMFYVDYAILSVSEFQGNCAASIVVQRDDLERGEAKAIKQPDEIGPYVLDSFRTHLADDEGQFSITGLIAALRKEGTPGSKRKRPTRKGSLHKRL